MNYEITDEQTMLLDSLRAFVETQILPHEEIADEAAEVPPEIGERIKDHAIEMWFFAANLPESAGGGGLDYSTLGLIERELGKGSYALGAFIARPTELLLACEGEQIEKYLATCVSGEKHECFALTEPGAGSDIMAMTTKAAADGDDYIINGSKELHLQRQFNPDACDCRREDGARSQECASGEFSVLSSRKYAGVSTRQEAQEDGNGIPRHGRTLL